jgi:hypothetical protein
MSSAHTDHPMQRTVRVVSGSLDRNMRYHTFLPIVCGSFSGPLAICQTLVAGDCGRPESLVNLHSWGKARNVGSPRRSFAQRVRAQLRFNHCARHAPEFCFPGTPSTISQVRRNRKRRSPRNALRRRLGARPLLSLVPRNSRGQTNSRRTQCTYMLRGM